MQPRALGRFLAEFLEGFAGAAEPVAAAEPAPVVVPVEMVRDAVAAFLQPLVDADDAQPGSQTDLFADAMRREPPVDPIAEATLRRVHETNAREEQRRREEAMGAVVPRLYDPNDPGSGQPWMAPDTERNTA